MKITIDTKEDTHEEIMKIVTMLSSLAGKEVMSNEGDVFEKKDADLGTGNLFGMFDNNEQSSEKPEEQSENPDQEEEDNDGEELDLGIPQLKNYD